MQGETQWCQLWSYFYNNIYFCVTGFVRIKQHVWHFVHIHNLLVIPQLVTVYVIGFLKVQKISITTGHKYLQYLFTVHVSKKKQQQKKKEQEKAKDQETSKAQWANAEKPLLK